MIKAMNTQIDVDDLLHNLCFQLNNYISALQVNSDLLLRSESLGTLEVTTVQRIQQTTENLNELVALINFYRYSRKHI
jgi:hypothetical protein